MTLDSQPTPRALVRFIRAHGHEARIDEGQLTAREVFTMRLPDGTVTTGSSWVVLSPTVSAVRDWLGY